MREAREVDVEELIDARPFGIRQAGIVALCGFVALLDGFDIQAIGLVGPALATAFAIPSGTFGAIFSASLAGTAVGAFGLGPLADRIGRKRVLVGSTLCFGVFTLLTTQATSVSELLLYRFLTGIGLGGAMPSFVSLACEYTPRRLRPVVIGLLWAGIPLGGVAGGFLASQIVPDHGWQSLFWIGGLLPILLSGILVLALPESISFLANRGRPAGDMAQVIRRVFPDAPIPADVRFVVRDAQASGASVRLLFASGRAGPTMLLWASFFLTFMMLVMNTSWTPTLLQREGVLLEKSAVALAVFNLGSVAGTALSGYLVRRIAPVLLLPVAFAGTTLSLGAVGQAVPSLFGISALQGVAGIALGIGTSAIITLAAALYPAGIRTTAVGWAMGVGRFGAFAGPLAIGGLVAWLWPIPVVFLAMGLPALLVAFTVGHLSLRAPLGLGGEGQGRQPDGPRDLSMGVPERAQERSSPRPQNR